MDMGEKAEPTPPSSADATEEENVTLDRDQNSEENRDGDGVYRVWKFRMRPPDDDEERYDFDILGQLPDRVIEASCLAN